MADYPISYSALHSIISRQDNSDGSGSATGYGLNDRCGSNGIVYDVRWGSTEQLGRVKFPPGGANCIAVWIVPKNSQPDIDEPPENENIPYDCINGACVQKKIYSTPGIFKSISECETACGTGCSGQCIPNDEWNKIQSLANQLKNKNCS